MGRFRGLLLTIGLVTAGVLAAWAGAAEVSLPPPERSTIVASETGDEFVPYDFIMSPVEQIRRDLFIDEKLRVSARVTTTTYRIPDTTAVEEVARHYLERLGEQVVFSCTGLDCGGSNYWANRVFSQARLYGLDRKQFYAAAQLSATRLVMVYAVRRGNKRKYAHVVQLETREPVTTQRNVDLAARLSGTGYVVLEAVTPDRSGTLTAPELAALRALAPELAALTAEVFVVCHLYGSRPATELLATATRCAEAAAEALQPERGPTLKPFGAGPLLPRAGAARPRIELIMPRRLEYD